jgi:hypothetical protein
MLKVFENKARDFGRAMPEVVGKILGKGAFSIYTELGVLEENAMYARTPS